MTDDAPDAMRLSPPASSWENRSPCGNPGQGQNAQGPAMGEQQSYNQQGYDQQAYGQQGPSGYGQPSQPGQDGRQPGRTTRTARSRIAGGFLWCLLVIAGVGTLVMLSQALNATTSGHDPTLGAHPVRTVATVEDYDVFSCNRGGSCDYEEKVAFGTATGVQRLTISVDTRPDIGGTQTLWYPAGNPSAAQTDGPHGAGYYWLATLGFGVATSLLVLGVVRRRRRAS